MADHTLTDSLPYGDRTLKLKYDVQDAVACPRCGVTAGAACVSLPSRTRYPDGPHHARIRAYKKAIASKEAFSHGSTS